MTLSFFVGCSGQCPRGPFKDGVGVLKPGCVDGEGRGGGEEDTIVDVG